jgi:hypothetical protein
MAKHRQHLAQGAHFDRRLVSQIQDSNDSTHKSPQLARKPTRTVFQELLRQHDFFPYATD